MNEIILKIYKELTFIIREEFQNNDLVTFVNMDVQDENDETYKY